ncbi:ABC transporter ATP-binding protein [Amphibacillus sp. Q70]|uniref:ABC transporter ATP-binding protein n=1 Tax=Amphibacillus sp. Q70 TaxID=3453416 RepID=UPI003F872015
MILSIKDLTFGFRKHTVFSKAQMKIEQGGIYGLVAPNGAGKTTLLYIIAQLYPYYEGEMELFGEEQTKAKSVTQHIALVQDNSVLYPYLSAYDHLSFICDMHGIDQEKIEQMAHFLGMESYLNQKVKRYSLGMKQRLLLAIGLIRKPKFLLLDEPLNGLDPTSTILMREALVKASEEGTTILVSSHNLNEIDKITNKVFFIKDEKILYEETDCSKQEILSLYFKEEALDQALAWLEKQSLNYVVEHTQIDIELTGTSAADLIKEAVKNEVDFIDIRIEVVGTENRYRALFESSGDDHE